MPPSLDAGRVLTFATLPRPASAKHKKPMRNLLRTFVPNLHRKLPHSAASSAYPFHRHGVGYPMANRPTHEPTTAPASAHRAKQ